MLRRDRELKDDMTGVGGGIIVYIKTSLVIKSFKKIIIMKLFLFQLSIISLNIILLFVKDLLTMIIVMDF
jgi:hypothetical protein